VDGVARRPASRIADVVLPHALMVAVMVVTMAGGHSPLTAIGGAALLVLASLGYGVVARVASSEAAWAHIVDLWAMALVLVLTVSAPLGHAHGSAGAAPAAANLWFVLAGWAVVRALLAAKSGARLRMSCATAGVSALGLVLMCVLAH